MPQCSSALFLSSSIELLFYSSCCTFSLAGHAAFSSSIFLTSLFLPCFCAFSLLRRAGFLFFCWCAFPPTRRTTLACFYYDRHFLYLCPSSLHLKHLTAIPILLIILSSTPHCITLLDKTSNLFWGATSLFSFSLLFLQFWARYLNSLQLQHSHFFFPSNFALNEVRACFCLSKLLINELYWSRDIVLYLLNRVRK